MLVVAGYTQPVIDRMMGLTQEPLNVRIINQVLLEILKHPNVAADAQAAFGVGVDWVKGSYLDHGFADAISTLAADALRARANDEYYAEREAERKRLRSLARAAAVADYRAGFIDSADASSRMIDEFFVLDMAHEELETVDAEVLTATREKIVASIKDAYMRGVLPLDQAAAQMELVPVMGPRWQIYQQEWTWERTERVRTLETGQILTAMKNGLLSSSVALARLRNLGWSNPDALTQIAEVEQTLAMSAAKTAAASASRAASLAAKEEREHASRIEEEAKEKAKTAAAERKKAAIELVAPVERKAWADKYAAQVLGEGSAWFTAKGKGDEAGQMAALAGAIADYDEWLAKQAGLLVKEETAGATENPVEGIKLSVPEQGAGDSTPAGPAPAPQNGAAKSTGSGSDAGGAG